MSATKLAAYLLVWIKVPDDFTAQATAAALGALGPRRPAIRGNANMYGTSMAAPTAHAMPTRPGLPPSATTWME